MAVVADLAKPLNVKTIGDLGRNKYFRVAAALVDLASGADWPGT